MAAFSNIIDLRFAVGDYVGGRPISDVFPRLVEMIEAEINRDVRVRQQIAATTLTFDEGVAPLPPDFLEILHVYGPCGYQMRAGTQADFLRPGSGYHQYEIGPRDITVRGFTGDKDIQYYARIPSLTRDATCCNWLLSRYPGVYLYGVAREAAKHLRDADLALAAQALFEQEIRSLRIDDERARWSGAVVRTQGLTP